MGRRALRKIDPAIDLERHLKTWEQLPHPWEPAAIFGRDAPLEIEIGSGKGLFLASAAAAHPDMDYLGCEIAAKYARFAAARLAQSGLPNACVVNADARRLFVELLPDVSVHAVHIYFPDPWWKARHKKRRIVNETMVRHIERTLAAGGILHFWSDVREYFDSSLALIAAQTPLAGPFDVPESQPHGDLDYRTHFERRMRLGGEPVYRATFEKR